MALVVEDGTGLETANAYVSVAGVTAYLTERQRATAWAALTSDQQEAAIIKATEYIDTRFGTSFKGCPLVQEQALEFPRSYLYDRYGRAIEGVPVKLANACAEYADRARAAELVRDPSLADGGQRITAETHTLGPITDAFTYESGVAPTFRPYPAADLLLAPFLVPGGRAIV